MATLNNFYNGNPRLKKSGIKQNYTKKQIEEYKKCRDDILYFADNYAKIITLDDGLVNIKLRDYQKRLIKDYVENRFNIVLASRQCGKTIFTAIYLCHYLIFNSHKSVAIVANKAKTAREILHRIKRVYEHLPFFLQIGVTEWNKSNVEMGNGSSIVAGSTTSDTIRGFTFNVVMVDEAGFIDGFEDFYTSTYPVISSGKASKIILISTPNGVNLFHKLFKEATLGHNTYKASRIDWWEVDHYDEAWKEETIKNIGQLRFDQEYGNKFLGSSGTLITGQKLELLSWEEPIETTDVFNSYESVQTGHRYVITVDPSEGTGHDSSVCNIIDITVFPYKQVAVYRNNLIQPLYLPEIIMALAKTYNNAYVLVETNSIGAEVGHTIYYDYEYDNIITSVMKNGDNDVGASGKNIDYGIRMTKKSKMIGCSNLKQIIETDKLLIQDFQTIEELNTFSKKGKSYEAEDKKFDDIVMSLVSFAWLTTQEYFTDLFDVDVKREILDKIKGDALMPLPVGFLPTDDNINHMEVNYQPDYGVAEVNNYSEQLGGITVDDSGSITSW